MCASASNTFAWVGAVLVNFGYCTLIWWGTSTKWSLGFILAALYAAVLFGLANYIYRKENNLGADVVHPPLQEAILEDQEQDVSGEPEVENTESRSSTAQSQQDESALGRTTSVLVSLLFGLAVIALGVTGSFLPVNLFADCYDYGWKPEWEWSTNLTSLPEGVRAWAKEPFHYGYYEATTFGYIVDVDMTLFAGKNKTSIETQLFGSRPQGPPVPYENIEDPDNFVEVSNQTLCFQATSRANRKKTVEQSLIYCTNGKKIDVMEDPTKRQHTGNFDFFVFDEVLWAKETTMEPQERGDLVYSVDIASMIMKLHSERNDTNYRETKKCKNTIRKQASLSLFVVALPVTLMSLIIWRSKQIPSMGVTTFIGLTLIYGALIVMIDPKHFDRSPPWNWWFTLSGAAWVLVLSCFVLKGTDSHAKGPMRWGLVIGGISYMSGTYMLMLGNYENDTFSEWLTWNFVALIPMTIVGAATHATFLMFLGALGFLIDAARLAEFFGEHIKGDESVPVQFLVFSIAGIMVGALGMELNKYQPSIENFAETSVETLSELRARRVAVHPVVEETDRDFEDIDSPLLHSDDNT